MKTNLKSKTSLEGKKGVFFGSSLIIVMSLSLLAFEWGKSDYKINLPEGLGQTVDFLDERVPITERPKPEQQQQQKAQHFIIAPDPDFADPDWEPISSETGIYDKLRPYIPPKDNEDSDSNDPISPIFIPYADWPSFPGGEEARNRFMGQNLTYPRLAVQENIQGSVVIGFVVEKDGSITNVKILKDIGGGCGDEAARVVKMMPNWSPGKQRGRPVKVRMSVPVAFRLALN